MRIFAQILMYTLDSFPWQVPFAVGKSISLYQNRMGINLGTSTEERIVERDPTPREAICSGCIPNCQRR